MQFKETKLKKNKETKLAFRSHLYPYHIICVCIHIYIYTPDMNHIIDMPDSYTIYIIYKYILSEQTKWKSLTRVQLFATPWNSLGQNTGVSSLSLLQGILPIQGSNSGLLHHRCILYQLSHNLSNVWVKYSLPHFSNPNILRCMD